MPVQVVSDLHGACDPLRKAVPEGSTLLLLGDLLNVIDYFEMTGILVEIFGREAVAQVSQMRLEGNYEEARRLISERSDGRREEIRSEFTRLALLEYEEVFRALPDPTYVILGNVDIPPMARNFVENGSGIIWADGEVFEIEGERFGFVGGALPTPLHVAGEITPEEMLSKIEGLGEVDVLCTHIPPAVPELCYDTLAGKSEQGSEAILGYIQDTKPRRHYFGHVHQPLVSSMKVGETLCINVGYFRATKRAFPHG